MSVLDHLSYNPELLDLYTKHKAEAQKLQERINAANKKAGTLPAGTIANLRTGEIKRSYEKLDYRIKYRVGLTEYININDVMYDHQITLGAAYNRFSSPNVIWERWIKVPKI